MKYSPVEHDERISSLTESVEDYLYQGWELEDAVEFLIDDPFIKEELLKLMEE